METKLLEITMGLIFTKLRKEFHLNFSFEELYEVSDKFSAVGFQIYFSFERKHAIL
jgi:hypothetical protein